MARLQSKIDFCGQKVLIHLLFRFRNPQKGTSAGRNGSIGVLIMSVSSIVPEKSRENKKKL